MDERIIHFRLDTTYRHIGLCNRTKVVLAPAFNGTGWFVKYQEGDKEPVCFIERQSTVTLRDFLLDHGFNLLDTAWDKEPAKRCGYNPFVAIDRLYGEIESNVYFAKNPASGLIKIGYTKNVSRRLSQLRVEFKARVSLLGLLQGDKIEEEKLHELFSSQRVTGEWFRECPEILDFIEEYCYMPPNGLLLTRK